MTLTLLELAEYTEWAIFVLSGLSALIITRLIFMHRDIAELKRESKMLRELILNNTLARSKDGAG